jgi:hypothetical protein
MAIEVFAIRQRSSGLFIPRLPKGHNRGGSYLEPSNEREPRIFHNRNSARAFLTNWLKGKYVRRVDDIGEDFVKIEPQNHRNKDDMEIVRYQLTPSEE